EGSWRGVGGSRGRASTLPGRGRYLIAKYRMKKKISPAKKTATPSKNPYSASTRGAMVEACSGQRRNADSILPARLPLSADASAPLTMHHDPYARTQGHYSDDASQAERPQDAECIRAALGIVVVTQEQELIDRRADLVL